MNSLSLENYRYEARYEQPGVQQDLESRRAELERVHRRISREVEER